MRRRIWLMIFAIALFCRCTADASSTTPLTGRSAGMGDGPFAPGTLIEHVACRGDATQTYSLYLPSSYLADRQWPLLFVFDPRGRSALAARVFMDGAEKYGWIIASSDNTLSDGPWEPNARAVSAMWPDVLGRFAVDRRRIYTAAFSGTAVIGPMLSRGADTPVAGLIATGARNVEALKYDTLAVPWFGAAGARDFNYLETRQITDLVRRAGQPARFVAFDGMHEWFPSAVGTRALGWMELIAMKRQWRARDERLIDAAFASETGEARNLAGQDPLEGMRRLEEIAVTFDGLHDVQVVRAEASRLASSEAVGRLRKEEENAARFERREGPATVAKLQELLARDPLPGPSEMLGELRVKDLGRRLSKGGREGEAAGRVLALLLSQAGFYRLQERERAGDLAAATLLRGVADAVRAELRR